MADNAKEELRPTTAQDTEAAAAASEGQSQEQESGKPPKEPGTSTSPAKASLDPISLNTCLTLNSSISSLR